MSVRLIAGYFPSVILGGCTSLWKYPQLAAQHRTAAMRYAIRCQVDIKLADVGRLTDGT
ncbi:hypothetical protein [Streptomyces sp. ISL-94]|uniref:hypothetical protein n=1 Tax=Streptomyces sp. ISL-94 TaxID=2819190 RepID=UPI001BE59EF8|nr:hypothetical protein [Streptomyces sp. ISL-94]